jgi:predicted ATP-dependent serine protease
MLSTEDSLTKTVVPQLLKWGATKNDLRRLYLLEEDFTLDAEGVAMVERAIEELKPDMVFLDPIVSFIGSDVDMNSQNQVRNVLRPLAGLAKRHNVPIVTVAHARKSGGRARFRGLLRSGPLRHHGLSGRGWDQHHDPSQG